MEDKIRNFQFTGVQYAEVSELFILLFKDDTDPALNVLTVNFQDTAEMGGRIELSALTV